MNKKGRDLSQHQIGRFSRSDDQTAGHNFESHAYGGAIMIRFKNRLALVHGEPGFQRVRLLIEHG
jgi:hypothetical protein